MLVELANQTVATAQQIAVCFNSRCRIRKRGTGDGIVRRSDVSMSVRGLNGSSVDDESEQQKRKRARKHTMFLD